MRKEMESFASSAIFFGVISLLIYFFLLRPILAGGQPQEEGGGGNNVNNNAPAAANRGQPRTGANQTQRGGATREAASSFAAVKSTRTPPNINPQSTPSAGGTNILVDGLLAFRHTEASTLEASLDTETQASNRKDRARILAKLLDEGLSSPPGKGSTLVVSIPAKDVDNSQVQRVIYLLATFYNLLLILAVDEKTKDKSPLVARLRKNELKASVLPDHRIVAASSVAGRVAFVRQLQRIELVFDFDSEVKDLLSRFGHKVILYKNGLGSFLS